MEYTKSITIRIKPSDYQMLAEMAAEQETTISMIVRKTIINLRKEAGKQ